METDIWTQYNFVDTVIRHNFINIILGYADRFTMVKLMLTCKGLWSYIGKSNQWIHMFSSKMLIEFTNQISTLSLINEYHSCYDKSITMILYRQGYKATTNELKEKYKVCIGDRIKYYRLVIRVVGCLNMLYNKACEERYKFEGAGYGAVRDHFNLLIKY